MNCNYSYNRKNLWAVIGNFFIGTAPIICGSLLLFFSMKFLMPEAYYEMMLYAEDLQTLQGSGFSFSMILYLLAIAFAFIAMCIALHMNLSGADLKGALPSLPFVIIIIVGANLLLGYFTSGLYISYLNFMNMIGSFLLAILIFSLVISLGYILVVVIIKYGIKLIIKLKR